MTKEEAMVFMDNLIICIKEHPILADWLVEIENRKDKPQTETSTNEGKVQLTDEPQCDTCKYADKEWYEDPCDRCAYMELYDPKTESQTDCAWGKGEE